MEKNKDMVDEIRTAAHGEARKRNKSQDNAAHETNADEESKPKSVLIQSSNGSRDKSAQDDLDDPEVDKAFFYGINKKEELKTHNEPL